MIDRIIADLLVILHLGFILFVGLGGLAVFRRPYVAWLHLPAVIWGVLISFFGWSCPLTSLENDYRDRAGDVGYDSGFIDHYILPLIYPERVMGNLPSSAFIAIGVFVVVLNSYIYWKAFRKR